MCAVSEHGVLNNDIVRRRMEDFLSRMMKTFGRAISLHHHTADGPKLAEQIFDTLTGREFCYLSRRRVSRYRPGTLKSFQQAIGDGRPLTFYYDIGSGYHATTRIDETSLVFDIGFGELCMLSQIAKLCAKIRSIYSPGARFFLVVDNVCGLITNDIPLSRTEAYCQSLRRLIRQVGMNGIVDLIVESEKFSASDYHLPASAVGTEDMSHRVTQQDQENVSRFLGRTCDAQEANRRMSLYGQALEISDRKLTSVMQGVRMTQRATEQTLCFRSFPGSDSRIQCGEVVLTMRCQKAYPMLLTCRNILKYSCQSFRFPGLLPETVPCVRFARPLAPSAARASLPIPT